MSLSKQGYFTIHRPNAVSAILIWNFATVLKCSSKNLAITILLVELPDRENRRVFQCSPEKTKLVIPFKLTPGQRYEVTVTLNEMRLFKHIVGYCKIESYTNNFRAEYTSQEFNKLYIAAVSQTLKNGGHPLLLCEHLYRNKSETYFNQIFQSCNGMMQTYYKTSNGSPENYINGIMKGLFFSAAHVPQATSPFGPIRLYVPATTIFTECANLYFADFYCNKRTHKVTLVLTVEGTIEDIYSRSKMILLDKFKNPFLILKPQIMMVGYQMIRKNHVYVTNANGIIIEVFCAGDINLKDATDRYGAYFVKVNALYNCTPQHVYKNKLCNICNITQQESDKTL